MIAIDQFLKELCPLRDLHVQFSGLFFSLHTDIHLIFGTLLCHTNIIQIKFEFGSDPLIFHEVMALGLREKITNYQF
jgi:hypothetical protein